MAVPHLRDAGLIDLGVGRSILRIIQYLWF